VIRTHLYWGYKLSRAEELLKVTAVCPTVCNLSCEREDVTLDPNKVTCPACRERAKARSEQERTRANKNLFLHGESLVCRFNCTVASTASIRSRPFAMA
jgi:hypothetical protein